jgi:hypothetical protein
VSECLAGRIHAKTINQITYADKFLPTHLELISNEFSIPAIVGVCVSLILFEMFPNERDRPCVGRVHQLRVAARQAVAGAGDGDQLVRQHAGGEGFGHGGGLVVGHVVVFGAVDQERRRVVGGDAADWQSGRRSTNPHRDL